MHIYCRYTSILSCWSSESPLYSPVGSTPCSSDIISQNLAPIWLPHWPHCIWTISRGILKELLQYLIVSVIFLSVERMTINYWFEFELRMTGNFLWQMTSIHFAYTMTHLVDTWKEWVITTGLLVRLMFNNYFVKAWSHEVVNTICLKVFLST